MCPLFSACNLSQVVELNCLSFLTENVSVKDHVSNDRDHVSYSLTKVCFGNTLVVAVHAGRLSGSRDNRIKAIAHDTEITGEVAVGKTSTHRRQDSRARIQFSGYIFNRRK